MAAADVEPLSDASAPKTRVSFARKGKDAVIDIHADGTTGAAEPLLSGAISTSTPAGSGAANGSNSPAGDDSAASAPASSAEGLDFARPGLRSGRKKAHLTIKNNAVAPMPGHKPLFEQPPSRSVSLLHAGLV